MRATRLTLTLLATAAWLLSAQVPAARAQTYRTEQTRGAIDLHEYHTLVLAYLEGDRDAVRRLQAWPLERLAAVIGRIEVPGAGPFQWNAKRLIAAALLHTEAALDPVPNAVGGSVPAHIRFAAALLAKGAPNTNAFASRWYVAATGVLCDRAWLADVTALLDLGRRLLPGDRAVLCESGRFTEYLAGNTRNLGPSSPRELAGADDPVTYQRVRSKREVLLTRAAGWLRASVDADASDPICRLHLGRVESLLGRDKEAEPLLRDLQQDRDDAVSYLASMFLGGAAERRNQLAGAEPFYRAAIARFPLAQAAYVALSSVLLRSGRISEARLALAQSVNDVADERRDPWWWYHLDPTPAADARMDALLKEGLQ